MALRFSIATALVLVAAVSWSSKPVNATLVSVTSEWITGDHHGRVGGDLSGPVGSIFASTPPTIQFEFIYTVLRRMICSVSLRLNLETGMSLMSSRVTEKKLYQES